jgi:hypothetical protein
MEKVQGIGHPITFIELNLKVVDTIQKQLIPFMTNILKWEWIS